MSPLILDLKPDFSIEEIMNYLHGQKSMGTKLKKILSNEAISLLKECTSKEDFLDASIVSYKIKKLEIIIKSVSPIEEAISTGGGVDLKEMDENFSLKKYPHVYLGGEMLD